MVEEEAAAVLVEAAEEAEEPTGTNVGAKDVDATAEVATAAAAVDCSVLLNNAEGFRAVVALV